MINENTLNVVNSFLKFWSSEEYYNEGWEFKIQYLDDEKVRLLIFYGEFYKFELLILNSMFDKLSINNFDFWKAVIYINIKKFEENRDEYINYNVVKYDHIDFFI